MNTVASLPEKWRDELAEEVSPSDVAYNHAKKACATELEAALATPAVEDGGLSEELVALLEIRREAIFASDNRDAFGSKSKRDEFALAAAAFVWDRGALLSRRLATPEQPGSAGELAAWHELADHVRIGFTEGIWPGRYTDDAVRVVAQRLRDTSGSAVQGDCQNCMKPLRAARALDACACARLTYAPPAPAAEQGAIVADVAKEAGAKVSEVLKFLNRALAMNATGHQRISHGIAGCVVEHFRAQPEVRGVEAYLIERLEGKGYGPARTVVDATVYDATSPKFWVDGGVHNRHRVTPLAVTLNPVQADGLIGFSQPGSAIRTVRDLPAEQPEGKGADRMAIRLLVAAGHVTEAKANEALCIAHGFEPGPLAPAAPVGVDEERVTVPRSILYGIIGSFGRARAKHVAALSAALAGKEGAK